MTDLTIRRSVYIKALRTIRATVTPRSAKGTAWLSRMIMVSDPIELDKPVTLSLDGALEICDLARTDDLEMEGL